MSRSCKFFLLPLLAIVESSFSPSAIAYVIGGPRWPADAVCTGDACLNQPFTIRYSYFPNMFDGNMKMPDGSPLPNSIIRESIEEALDVWANAIPVNFIEVPYPSPAELRFSHYHINGPDPPNGPPTTKAVSSCLGRDTFCEIDYDDGDPWQEAGELSKPDVLGATIHEVGHFLGLNHSADPTANMYPTFHRTTGLGTGQLFEDDIEGIHVLYGSGTGSVSPAVVPEPATGVWAIALLAGAPLVRPRRPTRLLPPLAA